jgi:hypothetical protein
MNRKTESLAYPADPLAAIRELQELDARPGGGQAGVRSRAPEPGSTQAPRPPPQPKAAERPPTLDTGGAVANAVGSEGSSATISESDAVSRARARVPADRTEVQSPEHESGGQRHSIAEAVRAMLARPYTSDPRKGPFTVSTVKIPTEVWERLGWLSAWAGRPKQEIIADALREHFMRILKDR